MLKWDERAFLWTCLNKVGLKVAPSATLHLLNSRRRRRGFLHLKRLKFTDWQPVFSPFSRSLLLFFFILFFYYFLLLLFFFFFFLISNEQVNVKLFFGLSRVQMFDTRRSRQKLNTNIAFDTNGDETNEASIQTQFFFVQPALNIHTSEVLYRRREHRPRFIWMKTRLLCKRRQKHTQEKRTFNTFIETHDAYDEKLTW